MKDFEHIYKTYFSRIYKFLYKLCGDEGLAEELSQETFYQAFKSFHRYNGSCELFTWIAAIGKHTYYQYLRKNKQWLSSVSLDSIAETYCLNNPPDSPEETLQREYVRQAVRNIVDKIPQKYADVVILRIYSELPFSEVGRTLGITENSAKVIFFRAKKMLMEALDDELKL